MSEEDKPKQPQEPESPEAPAPEAGEKETPAPSEPAPKLAAPEKPESPEASAPEAGEKETPAPSEPASKLAAPEKPESPEASAPKVGEKETPAPSEPSPKTAAPEKPESPEASASKVGEKEIPAPTEPSPKTAAPEKAAKPAPPKAARKKVLSYEDLEEDNLLQRLKEKFSEGIVSGQSFLNQPTYTVSVDCLYDVMIELKDSPDGDFDYLIDLTALDYLGDEQRFCMVYHLYSYKHDRLIRIKARISEEEAVPSVTSIWKTANWMEREVYDMFGIDFSGHDDLKRILLPDDWHGHPLRKDYDIKLQDQAWIKKHLNIIKTPA